MLRNCAKTLPFILIRVLLGVADIVLTIWITLSFNSWLMMFMEDKVPHLFWLVITPMSYIIGLGLSMVVCYYLVGVVAYYFKLAHIIALTSIILDYNPSTMPTTIYALSEARKNFISLVVSYITTKSVIHALTDLKDTIMEFDILSRFKEPKSTMAKFVKNISVRGVRNVIDVTDEIAISYTWFTNDLYKKSDKYKRSKKSRSLLSVSKVQAKHMLESLVFTVRVFPHLMLNSLLYETVFIIISTLFTVGAGIFLIRMMGFSFLTLLYIFLSYRAVIQLFGYVVISSLRNAAYLHTFYGELSELEPFNVKESLSDLLAKVPGLSALAKLSGEKIDVTRGRGSAPVLSENISDVLRQSLSETARAFNLNESDLIITSQESNRLQENLDSLPDEFDSGDAVVEEVIEDTVIVPDLLDDITVEVEDITEEPPVIVNPFTAGPRGGSIR